MGIRNPIVVAVPPDVYHGFKGISEEESIIVNIPTEPYRHARPDEYRMDPHGSEVPYDWNRRDG